MAAVLGVCVILGSAAAVSERDDAGFSASRESAGTADLGRVSRSETVVAYGPNKVGAAEVAASSATLPGVAVVPRVSAPASLSTALQETPQLSPGCERQTYCRTKGPMSVAARRISALRRYIAAKHAAALRHTRFLGRPAFPTRYRWRETRSIPYLKHLAHRWQVRARTAWLVVVWVREPKNAIRFVFGPKYAAQAVAVAKCESGWSMTPRARNGQYLGMFQMGSYARATYGHGSTPLEQARAAYRYFAASGFDWSPWSCKPWGGA